MDPERRRLRAADDGIEPWRSWGPYLAERSWGTHREDAGTAGDPWTSFPFEHAHARPYRWVEDGLAGVCDDRQTWCFAVALWNRRDPFLKERLYGEPAAGPSAERWRYADNTPTHSWMRWRYLYPQAAFPYDGAALPPEAGDWLVDVTYAKAGPEDLCIRIAVRNAGHATETVHVLPTLWFRNTWSWTSKRPPGPHETTDETTPTRPSIRGGEGRLIADHPEYGRMLLVGAAAPQPSAGPYPLVCDNDADTATNFPRSGIGDQVVRGAPTTNPLGIGTKGALWYELTLAAGEHAELRLRLVRTNTWRGVPDLDADWADIVATRRAEADEFWRPLGPHARRPLAGLLWSKQFYHFEVGPWLDRKLAERTGRHAAGTAERNGRWRHMRNRDVVLVPDSWRRPYYTGWDLPLQAVACALVDPAYAKHQVLLLSREWYAHPNGQLPGYEGDLDLAGPPLVAWSALRVYEHDGSRDVAFLARIFAKLLVNFTWWVNHLDGRHPAWTVAYSLDMLEMALILAIEDDSYVDLVAKFLEHYAQFKATVPTTGVSAAASLRSLVPYCAMLTIPEALLDKLPMVGSPFGPSRWPAADSRDDGFDVVGQRVLSVVDRAGLLAVCARLLDDAQFLGGAGLRAGGDREVPYDWNVVIIHALRRYHAAIGDDLTVELPIGSSDYRNLAAVADELGRRVASAAARERPAAASAAIVAVLLDRRAAGTVPAAVD